MSRGSDCPHCGGELTRYWQHNDHHICEVCEPHIIAVVFKKRAKYNFHDRKEIHGYYDMFDIIMLETDNSLKGFFKRLLRMK